MKTLTRLAAVLAVLGVAAPALPCGLRQQSADATTTSTSTVARAEKTVQKAESKAQASTAKTKAAAPKRATVAKN